MRPYRLRFSSSTCGRHVVTCQTLQTCHRVHLGVWVRVGHRQGKCEPVSHFLVCNRWGRSRKKGGGPGSGRSRRNKGAGGRTNEGVGGCYCRNEGRNVWCCKDKPPRQSPFQKLGQGYRKS